MSSARKQIIAYKSIGWLLIVAILLVTLKPAHYHLHHAGYDDIDGPTAIAHEHFIDLHILSDKTGQAHHDDSMTIIAASPNGIISKTQPDLPPIILLAIMLFVLPALNSKIHRWPNTGSTALLHSGPHFTPRLRAPPSH